MHAQDFKIAAPFPLPLALSLLMLPFLPLLGSFKGILCIGASCRSLAESIAKLNIPVGSLDLFADRDLQAIARSEKIATFPESIWGQFQRWDGWYVMLGGGMENYPDVLEKCFGLGEQLSAPDGPPRLLGPRPNQIRVLRSLDNWRRWCEVGGDKKLAGGAIKFPEIWTDWSCFKSKINGSSTEDWLFKPYHGSAGIGIRRYQLDQTKAVRQTTGDNVATKGYLQKVIDGVSVGVTFLCTHERTTVYPIVKSLESLHRDSFVYTGCIGPYEVSDEQLAMLEIWMHGIATEVTYQGLLQADFIVASDGTWFLLEINPRWTASMEVIELITGRNLAFDHLETVLGDTNRHGKLTEELQVPQVSEPLRWMFKGVRACKKIIYADHSFEVDACLSDWLWNGHEDSTQRLRENDLDFVINLELGNIHYRWADIPNAGTFINKGEPIASWLVEYRETEQEEEPLDRFQWDEMFKHCANYFERQLKKRIEKPSGFKILE